MSWEWWNWRIDVRSLVEAFNKKWRAVAVWLSEVFRIPLEKTIEWLESILNELPEWTTINNTQAGLYSNAIDALYNNRRNAAIKVLDGWARISENDIPYLRDLLRLSKPWVIPKTNDEWLRRIFNWWFSSSDFSNIILDINWIDKNDCKSLILRKIWVKEEDLWIISELMTWNLRKWINYSIDELLIIAWKTHITATRDAILWALIKKYFRSFSINNLFLFIERFSDFFSNIFFKEKRNLTPEQRKIDVNPVLLKWLINKFRISEINEDEILTIFWYLKRESIASIVEIIINDSSIDEQDKHRILEILWKDYWSLIWKVIWLDEEQTLEVSNIINSKTTHWLLARKYDLIRSIHEEARYTVFWILLRGFNVDDLEKMQKEVCSKRLKEKPRTDTEDVKKEVSDLVREVLKMPDEILEKTYLEAYFSWWSDKEIDGWTKQAWMFRALSWLGWVVTRDWVRRPFSSLIKKWLEKIWVSNNDAESLWKAEFSELLRIARWCRFEGRKLIIEWYFSKRKSMNIMYWKVLDALFMNWLIEREEIFLNPFFISLINDFWENRWSARNIRYIAENYWYFANIFSPFLMRLIATTEPWDFERALHEIESLWINIKDNNSRTRILLKYDLSTIAMLSESWNFIKINDFFDEGEKRIKVKTTLSWLLEVTANTDLSTRRWNLAVLLRLFKEKIWLDVVKKAEFARLLDNFNPEVLELIEETIKPGSKRQKLSRIAWIITGVISSSKDEKKNNRTRRFTEILRQLNFSQLGIEWMLANADNSLMSLWYDSFALNVSKYIMYCVGSSSPNNKFKDAKFRQEIIFWVWANENPSISTPLHLDWTDLKNVSGRFSDDFGIPFKTDVWRTYKAS